MQPKAEFVHWLFATGVLMLALLLLAEAIVGQEVWRRRAWRAYLWPGVLFLMGLAMWPVMVLFTNSTIHMLAHGSWAQVMMVAGGAELGLARGKLRSRYWHLALPFALVVSGSEFLVHEANPWFFQRSAFLHHLSGWLLVGGAAFPLLRTFRPRSMVLSIGTAALVVAISVVLYADRDLAPIFGHLSSLAGKPHR